MHQHIPIHITSLPLLFLSINTQHHYPKIHKPLQSDLIKQHIRMRLCLCLWVLAFCILASDLGALADVRSLISKDLFEQILKHRNDAACEGKGFYTYEAFVNAANSFGAFATTGDTNTRKREIAAFLAQTSHETTGGWASAPDGPYAWGYCFIRERNNPGAHCTSKDWPCPPGKQYYGRGPIQLTHNYNYGQAGRAIRADLINNPDLLATDAVISFKTAFWFWMTPQSPKPSCHAVIIGQWKPSTTDTQAGRVPGYGVTTNIINGGKECGKGSNPKMENRVGFYQRYCQILGVDPGSNLDCSNQRPFNV